MLQREVKGDEMWKVKTRLSILATVTAALWFLGGCALEYGGGIDSGDGGDQEDESINPGDGGDQEDGSIDPGDSGDSEDTNCTDCAADSGSLVFPVKILFIMDDSGSMTDSDPGFRRLAAARELVNMLIDEPEVYFGVEKFQDGDIFLLTTDPIFTSDRQKLDWALADAQHQPGGWTPYIGALSVAITGIKSDMNEDPIMAGRTRYIVLFISDGEPTDEPDPPYTHIEDRVTQLKQLEEGEPAAGEVTLHTAYLESDGNPGSSHVQLLQKMAEMTRGEFRNFENSEAIDFSDYDVTPISHD
jgi:hypothetical protein